MGRIETKEKARSVSQKWRHSTFFALAYSIVFHVPPFTIVDSYYLTTSVNYPFVSTLKAVTAVDGVYEFHNVLRMAIATWIVALRNQFIPCTSKEHFVAFFHLLYTATRRIVEFPRVGVDDIICTFWRRIILDGIWLLRSRWWSCDTATGVIISSKLAVLSEEIETDWPSEVTKISPFKSVRYTMTSASRRRLRLLSVGCP